MGAVEKEEKGPFDMIIIGAGPGGYVCAVRAAQLGFKVACVEKNEKLGGTCLNVGCIPSKAVLESSHHYAQAQHELSEHGVMCSEVKLDLKQMLKRKDDVVASITSGVEYLFKKNKITWLKGTGSVESSNTISVKDSKGHVQSFNAKHIVIATGSSPVEIPSAPFDHKFICDSTDALNFSKVPKHLIVIGGGVIGLELGSVWSRLGAKVSVVEALDHILGATDLGVSKAMETILKKQGLEFYTSTFLEKTSVQKNKVIVTCKQKDKTLELEGDIVLVAVGRRAHTKNIGLEKLGITLEKNGMIPVDHKFATSVPGIYAIGDATPGPMLAHKAEEEGVALAEFLAGKPGHVNYEAIPSIVYTWPEVASVGKTEEKCNEDKIPFKTGKFFFKANGRAKAMGSTDGFVKILSHKETDRLLGIHIIGPMASEMIAEAAIAFEFGASAEDIARSVHAHPTLSEVMKEAALDVEKRAIHS